MSLSHREASHARLILLRIAKSFPQALFFPLRVSREDFVGVKKQQQLQQRIAAVRRVEGVKTSISTAGSNLADGSGQMGENKEVKEETLVTNGNVSQSTAQTATGTPMPPLSLNQTSSQTPRQPWDHVEEIMNMLKTAFPLLALTMEKMVDQISLRAKPASDEDIYRFFSALLADAMQQWGGRTGLPNDDGELNSQTKENLAKFATNLSGELKVMIEKDFMVEMPKLREYIRRLQKWRDLYEKNLDDRSKAMPLDQGGCSLTEFHHTKFDDVEIPGQYVQCAVEEERDPSSKLTDSSPNGHASGSATTITSKKMAREDTALTYYDRIKELHDPTISRLRAELMEEVRVKMVPETVITNYMMRTMKGSENLWLMRKQFATQTAATMFLTYVCCLSNRTPSRFYISRKTGLMYMSEILPAFAMGKPLIASSEAVPFRLTPNMQHFVTRAGVEGLISATCTAMARCLTVPDFDLSGTLCLFIRDEANNPLLSHVYENVDHFVRRVSTMGFLGENRDKMSETYMPWY
uniref:Putative histone acetyltransferase protein n=1 Tax=Cryptococcus depauperatus TaxID=5208 RepID=D2JWU7_9TREE|nr:putative histone acetyltransferase protein [Cryptococcus depauperatus]